MKARKQTSPAQTIEPNKGEALPVFGRLLKLREVVAETSLSHAVIYRRIRKGTFPGNVQLGGGRVAWLSCEIEDWKRRAIAGDFAELT